MRSEEVVLVSFGVAQIIVAVLGIVTSQHVVMLILGSLLFTTGIALLWLAWLSYQDRSRNQAATRAPFGAADDEASFR